MRGAMIGPYKVLNLLGSGGMGEVWLAEDTRLGRHVALKRLGTGRALVAGEMARIRREARAVARLGHPNIAVLYDLCEVEDPPLLVMEVVEGETLAQRLRRAPLATAEALRIAIEIARGLAHAHLRGVIHRDIKSANVMLTTEGRVKILDFGLARVSEAVRSDAVLDATLDARLNATVALSTDGAIVGTLSYMPPEQIRGNAADERSDVFSLGVVIYEMFSGRLPFRADSRAELVSVILRDPPHLLHELQPKVSPALSRVVHRCLQKDPVARFARAEDLVEALVRLETGSDVEHTARVEFDARVSQLPRPSQRFAVLDFTNLTADPSSNWLSGGIAETVAADLGKVEGIAVVSSERVVAVLAEQSVSGEQDFAALGQRLGVDYLVRGAFQKAGPRIRITASLFAVDDEESRASVKIDGLFDEIFELQDRVIESLLEETAFALKSSDRRRIARPQTRAVLAYELYARARAKIVRMGVGAFEEARALLLKALDLDPDYALVHTALGQMLAMRYIATTDPRDLDDAFAHLDRAIALDGDQGEPWVWKCYGLSRLGRFEEAIAAGRQAEAGAGANAWSHYFLGAARWLRAATRPEADDLESALESVSRAVQIDSGFQAAYMIVCDLRHRLGDTGGAREAARSAQQLEVSDSASVARFIGGQMQLGLLALHAGDLRSAGAALSASLERARASDHVYAAHVQAISRMGLARVAASEGDAVAALRTIDAAYDTARKAVRSVGIGRVLARLGFARVEFAALAGQLADARVRYERACAFESSREGYDFTGVLAAMDMDIHLDHARAAAALGHGQAAVAAQERAEAAGWRGFAW